MRQIIWGGAAAAVIVGLATALADAGAGAEAGNGPAGASRPSGFVPVAVDVVAERAYARSATAGGGHEVPLPVPGQEVFFHVGFRVDGLAGSVEVSLQAELDGESHCSFTTTISTSGSVTAFCNSGWTATAGAHMLRWEVQPIAADDSNAGNNVAEIAWDVGGAVDPRVSDAHLRTQPGGGERVDAPLVGQDVYFQVMFDPGGLPPSSQIAIHAEVDGERFCGAAVAARDEERAIFCSSPWVAAAGAHTLRWVVDEDDAVDETNESNNVATASWTSLQATATPTSTSVPTRTLTAEPAGTPTPVDLSLGIAFGRGDADCSLSRTAADVVAQIRGIAEPSVCGNDDCDRNGVVDGADLDCTVGCQFGVCPVPPTAPVVDDVLPDSAPAIVPHSSVRLRGNFPASGKPQSVRIGGATGRVVGAEGGDMIVIVPDLPAGTHDLVFSDGDVASAPIAIEVSEAQPIGSLDSFEDTLSLIEETLEAVEGTDLEAILGADEAAFVRAEIDAFQVIFADKVDALLDDPDYAAVQAQLDDAIEGAGIPEELREALDVLAGVSVERGSGVTSGPGITIVAGPALTKAGAAILTVAAAPAVAAGSSFLVPLATTVATAGALLSPSVASALAPVIRGVSQALIEPNQVLEVEWGGANLPFTDVNLLLIGPTGFEKSVSPMESGCPSERLCYTIPNEVGICNWVAAFLETPLLPRSPSSVLLGIKPVVGAVAPRSVAPGEQIVLSFVAGVGSCGPDSWALRQTEGDRQRFVPGSIPKQLSGGRQLVSTPLLLPGLYDLSISTDFESSAAPSPIEIGSDLTDLDLFCEETPIPAGDRRLCYLEERARVPEGAAYLWESSSPDILPLVGPADESAVWVAGARPGTGTLRLELSRTDVSPRRVLGEDSIEVEILDLNPPAVDVDVLLPASDEPVAPGSSIVLQVAGRDPNVGALYRSGAVSLLRVRGSGTGLEPPLEQEFSCPRFPFDPDPPPLPSFTRCENQFAFPVREVTAAESEISLVVEAVDWGGNVASEELDFVVDVLPDCPFEGTRAQVSVTVQGHFDDGQSKLFNVAVSSFEGEITGRTGSFSFSSPPGSVQAESTLTVRFDASCGQVEEFDFSRQLTRPGDPDYLIDSFVRAGGLSHIQTNFAFFQVRGAEVCEHISALDHLERQRRAGEVEQSTLVSFDCDAQALLSISFNR